MKNENWKNENEKYKLKNETGGSLQWIKLKRKKEKKIQTKIIKMKFDM